MSDRIFQHKPIRDLYWLLSSPNLIDGPDFIPKEWMSKDMDKIRSWLSDLDYFPEPIKTFLEKNAQKRLGKYCENLINFWIQESPYLKLRVYNKQVIQDGQTLGEFDFIFDDKRNNTVYHWELAVKFYLQPKDPIQWKEFIGPSAIDSLDEKLKNLKSKQLPLAFSPAGQIELQKLGVERPISKIFLKGYLFYHFSIEAEKRIFPAQANPEHLQGKWAYFSERKAAFKSDRMWYILDRLNWITPAYKTNEAEMLSFEKLDERLTNIFQLIPQARLIAEMVKLPDESWQEKSRIFIVPDNWPEDLA